MNKFIELQYKESPERDERVCLPMDNIASVESNGVGLCKVHLKAPDEFYYIVRSTYEELREKINEVMEDE